MSYKYFLIDDSDYDAGSQILVRTKKNYNFLQVDKIVMRWMSELNKLRKDIQKNISTIQHTLYKAVAEHFANGDIEDLKNFVSSAKLIHGNTKESIENSIEWLKKYETEKNIEMYNFQVKSLCRYAAEIIMSKKDLNFYSHSRYFSTDKLETWIELAEEWNINLDYEAMREEKNKFDSLLIPCYEDLELVKIEDVIHIYGSKVDKIPNEMFLENERGETK